MLILNGRPVSRCSWPASTLKSKRWVSRPAFLLRWINTSQSFKKKKKRERFSALFHSPVGQVFIVLFIKRFSLTAKDGRDTHKRREKREECFNQCEGSQLSSHTHCWISYSQTPTRQTQHTHTEILPKAKINQGKKKGGVGVKGTDLEIKRITKGVKIETNEWIECREKSRW